MLLKQKADMFIENIDDVYLYLNYEIKTNRYGVSIYITINDDLLHLLEIVAIDSGLRINQKRCKIIRSNKKGYFVRLTFNHDKKAW